MTIDVSSADISEAKILIKTQHRSTCCPIALALRRYLDVDWICVNLEIAYTNYDRFELPKSAVDFQKDFDACAKTEPLTFEINDNRNKTLTNFRPLHRLIV